MRALHPSYSICHLGVNSCRYGLRGIVSCTLDIDKPGKHCGVVVEEAGTDEGLGRSFFLSEQRKPLHRSTVNLLLHKYGEKAKLPVAVHPHMLRHACGFALADQGADTLLIQDYLGHRNIQHTVRYTSTNPARFEKLWR